LAGLEDIVVEADPDAGQVFAGVDLAGGINGTVYAVVGGAEGEGVVEEVGEDLGDAAEGAVADEDECEDELTEPGLGGGEVAEDGVVSRGPQREGEVEGEHLNAVVWANDRFVAVGAGATYFSADGRKWERKPNADAPVAFGDGVFVGAKWKGRLMRSLDAVKWEEVHRAERHVEAVAFGDLGERGE